MELIDTHCHLTFEGLAENIKNVILRSIEASVTAWITVGTNLQESRKAVELANKYEEMYAAVGVHPHYAKDTTGEAIAELRELAQNQKVVAIGETGLDSYDESSPRTDQQHIFVEHCRIANQFNLPLILHCRKAFNDSMDVLERFGAGINRVVFHCFSGSAEQARTVLNRGYCISFTGVVTFTNARKTQKAAKIVPLDRLMVETDCPYMSPEPVRTQQPNEPAFMIHTAKFLAQLKGMNLPDFAKAVTATSKVFFGLPPR